jgi:predicted dehydrogenase
MQSPHYKVVGCFDTDRTRLQYISSEYGVRAYPNEDALISHCDVIDIVTPADSHFYYAEKALKQTKHIFVEKPIASTAEEALAMLHLAREAHVKIQVGHIERFNPAFVALKQYDLQPMFIEAHRLAMFDPRGTDVSVVHDLMIHDIDIVLSTVKSNVRRISASGVAVISATPDIANARIEFDNGCVANLTASRVSVKKQRKMRFFQKDAYLSVDFLEHKAEIFRLTDHSEGHYTLSVPGQDKHIIYMTPEVEEYNALEKELTHFAHCITHDITPIVSGSDGYEALSIALQIAQKIERVLPV